MDYKEKVERLKANARDAENLLAFRNRVRDVVELFRDSSKVKVYIENNGSDAKGYPVTRSESCPVVEEYREGIIEILKGQLERVNKELEELFGED